MTVNEFIEKLNAKIENISDGGRQISTGYCGDFLSHVMGRAPKDCVWFTIMTNANVAAVAHLCEVSAVVICEGSIPDETLKFRAQENKINLITTPLDIFCAAREFHESQI